MKETYFNRINRELPNFHINSAFLLPNYHISQTYQGTYINFNKMDDENNESITTDIDFLKSNNFLLSDFQLLTDGTDNDTSQTNRKNSSNDKDNLYENATSLTQLTDLVRKSNEPVSHTSLFYIYKNNIQYNTMMNYAKCIGFKLEF